MHPQNNSIKIRRAVLKDLLEICQLAEQLGYPDQPEKTKTRLEGLFQNPSHEIFVAENTSGRVLGFIHIRLQNSLVIDPVVEVGSLVVDQEFRGLGIGKSLLHSAEEWAKKEGCRQIRLHSNIIRSEAQKFYLNQGYTIIKTQHAFLKELT